MLLSSSKGVPFTENRNQNHSSLHKHQNKNVMHREGLKHSEIPICLNIDKNWYAFLVPRDFSFAWNINQIQQKLKPKLKAIIFLSIHLNSSRNFFAIYSPSDITLTKIIYRSEATFDDPSPVQSSPQVLRLALLNCPQTTLKRASTIHCFLYGYTGIVDTVLNNGLEISLGVLCFQFKCD